MMRRFWSCLPIVPLALAGCTQPPASATTVATTATIASGTAPPSLLGATPATLRAWIGPPILRRIDGPAQVWLYHSPLCRMDVVFYLNAAGTPHVNAAMNRPTTISPASCLASLERDPAS